MGSGVKDGDAGPSLVIEYHVSRISRAAWPLYLRRSLVIKHSSQRQWCGQTAPLVGVGLSALRSLLTRLLSLHPRPALVRFPLPETPMPGEPLIRVLETFDLSQENTSEEQKEYS